MTTQANPNNSLLTLEDIIDSKYLGDSATSTFMTGGFDQNQQMVSPPSPRSFMMPCPSSPHGFQPRPNYNYYEQESNPPEMNYSVDYSDEQRTPFFPPYMMFPYNSPANYSLSNSYSMNMNPNHRSIPTGLSTTMSGTDPNLHTFPARTFPYQNISGSDRSYLYMTLPNQSDSPNSQSKSPYSKSSVKPKPKPKTIPCPFPGCTRVFSRQYNMRAHVEIHAPIRTKDHPCPDCGRPFSRRHDMYRHRRNIHPPTAPRPALYPS